MATKIQLASRPLSSGRKIYFPRSWDELVSNLSPSTIRYILDEWIEHQSPLSLKCNLDRKDNPYTYIKLYQDQLISIRTLKLTISESVRQAIAWKFLQ